jgi:hypothetical protein
MTVKRLYGRPKNRYEQSILKEEEEGIRHNVQQDCSFRPAFVNTVLKYRVSQNAQDLLTISETVLKDWNGSH